MRNHYCKFLFDNYSYVSKNLLRNNYNGINYFLILELNNSDNNVHYF